MASSNTRRQRGELAFVDYRVPPVVEVVLSVAFRPISGLGMIQLANLWTDRFRVSFPKVEEQPPYEMPIEALDSPPLAGAFSFQVASVLPLPRLWFLDEAGSSIVQVQQDWFARNWRKRDAGGDYPRYASLRDEFSKAYGEFVAYLRDVGLEEPQPTQAEILYINHIEPEPPSKSRPLLSDVLTVVEEPAGVVGPPETGRIGLDFLIRHAASAVGRLHLTASPAIRKSDQAAILDMTIVARGRPVGDGIEGVLGFLDVGAAEAISVFNTLTTPAMHKRWGKK